MKNKKSINNGYWNLSTIIGMLILIISAISLSSFSGKPKLKGVWIFAGDINNGKKQDAPADYILQRKYNSAHFEAFFIEKDSIPVKYEAGDYILKNDSCFETQTFSSEPSKLAGVAVHYACEIRNDTLFLKGVLPGGTVVEEHWKREK